MRLTAREFTPHLFLLFPLQPKSRSSPGAHPTLENHLHGMAGLSGSTPPGSPPFRSPKARSRIAQAAARFEPTSSPSSPPSATTDSSRLRDSRRVDIIRGSYASDPTTPASHPKHNLSSSPTTTSTSPTSSTTFSTAPTTPPRPSHFSLADSPSNELASFFADLSITSSQDGTETSPASTTRRKRASSPLVEKSQEQLKRDDMVTEMGPPPLPSNGERKDVQVLPLPVAEKAGPPVDELALLVVSSSITELSMLVQEVNTLIFEIQELRHTTSMSSKDPHETPRPAGNGFDSSASPARPPIPSNPTPPSGDGPSPISEVDAALIKLDSKLEAVRTEFGTVDEQVKPLLGEAGSPPAEGELGFVRQKWTEMLDEWNTAQQDAEQLGDELKEDKFLVVFRTVAQQAEDMMRSMEKVLAQSEQFVAEAMSRVTSGVSSPARPPRSPSAPRSSPSSAPSYFPDAVLAQAQLSSFAALQKSLTAKLKYYSPATDRVLKILGKGIADRSTKNGEALRRYSEMKARWRNVRERISRAEAEMKGVEEILREQAGTAANQQQERTKQSEYGSTLTPPRPDGTSPGRLSPMRRLANKLSPRSETPSSASPSRRTGLPPSASSPSLSGLRSPSSTGQYAAMRASTSSSAAGPTPPRPPKSLKRLVSESQAGSPTATPPPRTPHALSHRRSASALSASVPSSATSSVFGTRSARPARHPASPTPADGRPRWNVSTKRTEEERETLRQSAMGSGRPSLAGAFPPSASKNGRHSAMGLRPSSRMSLASSMSRSYGLNSAARPISPAFSDASSVAHRERPQTPGSKIPMPSSAIKRSTTPFSSLDDPEPTSLLQRALSPTPSLASSTSRLPLTRATPSSAARSRLPTPGALSPSRPTSPALSAASSNRWRGQTPEPSLMAQAQRLAHVRPPPSASRPPPVPRVPSAFRTSDVHGTPRAGGSNGSSGRPSLSRPPSSLSTSRYGAMTPLPPIAGQPTDGSYTPNPHDPLDQSISLILSSLPLMLYTIRIDPHISRSQTAQMELFQARYQFSLHLLDDSRRAVMCKLVDRLGPRARRGEKKVLARVGGGWQDLEAHLLGLLATAV
ncbi:hypothetical protein JCM11641_007217 [Rhodosporidiobolus odoratus]